MRTALLTLLLTGFGLWAQTPPFTPLPSGASPDGLGTNRDQVLHEALRRALEGHTNTVAVRTSPKPVKAPVSTDWSALPAAGSPAAPPAPVNPTNALTSVPEAAKSPLEGPPSSLAPLPSDATPGGLDTNRDQLLREALRRALEGGTNAAAVGTAPKPVNAPLGAVSSAPAPVLRNTPGPLPAARPDNLAVPGIPAASVMPPAKSLTAPPAPLNPTNALASLPEAPKSPVVEPPPSLPSGAPPGGLGTNRNQVLREALRRAHARGTNAAASGPAANPLQAPLGAASPAPPPAFRNTPRPPPAAGPDNLPLPSGPAASIAPPSGMAAPAHPASPVRPVPGPAKSPLEEPLPEGMIDFRSADLSQVLDIYSLMVNRTILRPANLGAPTITLTTRGQLTMREGIQALEAVLALNGIVMVPVGDKFVKAMPEAQGGAAGGSFNTNTAAQLPDMGQFVTHVVQLKYAKPSEMMQVLTPFGKIPGGILAIEASQMLVLRDYTENVKRMLELIKEIDVAIPSVFVSEVIPIKYGQASDIASALNSLSSSGGGTSVGTGGSTGTRSSRTTGMGMNRSGSMGGMGGYPGQTTPGMVTPPGGAGGSPMGTPGSSFSQRLQNIIKRASTTGTGEIQVMGQTKIISDERTNSLLIYASPEDMKTIKDIIAKLDVVLPQVLIEAVIISVTLTDSRDLGVSYLQHPQNSGKWTGVGAINNNNFLQPNNFALSGATNITGSVPQGFSYLMSWNQDLDVTVTALAADSRAKILQRPRIQTSHNEPATLFVGESRPYPTSSYYGGGAYGGYSSIQQLQIGVTLEVTPLINPDGLVVMDIHNKIDSFEGNVTIQNVGDVPVTSSKEAAAKVSVRDHDTIILGGLIETDKNKSASGVPLLMDIPVLGNLFRTSHADEKRTELIVLIRPTVLPTPEIAALAATAEKNKMPGVRGTEKELRDDEMRRLKQANKADKTDSYQPVEKP